MRGFGADAGGGPADTPAPPDPVALDLEEKSGKLARASEVDFVSSTLTRFQSDLMDRFEAGSGAVPGDGAGTADALAEEAAGLQAAALAGAPSKAAADMARPGLEGFSEQLFTKARARDQNLGAIAIVDNTRRTLSGLLGLVERDPVNAAGYADLAGETVEAAVASEGIPPEVGLELRGGFMAGFGPAMLGQLMTDEPGEAVRRLKAGELDDLVGEPETIQVLLRDAERALVKRDAKDRAAFGAALRTLDVTVDGVEATFERGLPPVGLDALAADARGAAVQAEETGDAASLELAQDSRRRLRAIEADRDAVGAFSLLTLAAQGERIAALKAKASRSADDERLLGRYERLRDHTKRAVAEGDALALARDLGLFEEIAALDLNDPESFAARADQAAAASALFGLRVSPFQPREIEAIGRMSGQLDADGAFDMAARLRAGLGREGYTQATGQLARRHPGLSVALGLAETRPGLARRILDGLQLGAGAADGTAGAADPAFAAAFARVFGVAPEDIPAALRPHLEAALALRAANASPLLRNAGLGGVGIEDELRELAQAVPVPVAAESAGDGPTADPSEPGQETEASDTGERVPGGGPQGMGGEVVPRQIEVMRDAAQAAGLDPDGLPDEFSIADAPGGDGLEITYGSGASAVRRDITQTRLEEIAAIGEDAAASGLDAPDELTAEAVRLVFEILPGTGEVLSAVEAYDAFLAAHAAFENDDLAQAFLKGGEGVLATLGAIPVVGGTVLLGKGAFKVAGLLFKVFRSARRRGDVLEATARTGRSVSSIWFEKWMRRAIANRLKPRGQSAQVGKVTRVSMAEQKGTTSAV